MYKKGDIIKIQNPYGPAGTTSYFHCLITETRKHYMYNVLFYLYLVYVPVSPLLYHVILTILVIYDVDIVALLIVANGKY